MKNRLHLDFTIELASERKKFLEDYLEKISFVPNNEELELMANYILWGKSTLVPTTKNKGSVAAEAGITITTRNGTWDKKEKAESLEALIESPTFNEGQLTRFPIHYVTPKETFSRKKALKIAPDYIRVRLEDLWKEIDRLDLALGFYDWKKGKRKSEPRQDLQVRFEEEEKKSIEVEAQTYNQYTYLKKRHQLVELRRQQYTLKDFYAPTLIGRRGIRLEEEETWSWEEDLEVFPLGLFWKPASKAEVDLEGARSKKTFIEDLSQLIFKINCDPAQYAPEELQLISNFYWEKKLTKEKKDQTQTPYFDFRNLENVYLLLLNYHSLYDKVISQKNEHRVEDTTLELLNTLEFYIEMADLSDLQKEVLALKVNGEKNQDIAKLINQKYQKSYTTNYISTIFRQKIIKEINAAAQYHFDIIGNLFFPENFRHCNFCDRTLLLCDRNFVKKKNSITGYNSKCKKCEKEKRELMKRRKINGK